MAWGTANSAVLAEGTRVFIDDPARFDGVAVIGVDEHCWRHTRRSDRFVTVIIDLTPVRDGTGPARLLDMVAGRSTQAFGQWLADREPSWRDRVEVVAMDGFTGFKTATTEQLPEAVAAMDPFHVVRLAGDAVDQCRRRVQQAEGDDLGEGCGDAVADRVDQPLHQLAAAGPVGFAVGGDRALVDAPGGLDLDVLVGGEQGCEPGPLPVGEQVGAGVQGAAGGVERVAGAAAVPVQVLLDAAAALVQRVAGQAERNSQDLWIGVSRDLLITSDLAV